MGYDGNVLKFSKQQEQLGRAVMCKKYGLHGLDYLDKGFDIYHQGKNNCVGCLLDSVSVTQIVIQF